MYLSCLLIDVGNNPDRPRPGRLWLRNLYHVHQRLCMAFPSASRKADDVDFLTPFKPDEFGNGQVHVRRAAGSGFLFRIDPLPNGRVMILVQSALEPNWEYAFHNAQYLLAAPPEVKLFEPRFSKGQCLRFRLTVNPTRRLRENSPDAKEESVGKRVPVQIDRVVDWLDGRGRTAGFSVEKEPAIIVRSWYVYFDKNKPKNEKGDGDKRTRDQKGRLRLVRFDGVLRVTDPDLFRQTLIHGIGSGKAFGFGLLSVAPANTAGSGKAT